MSKTIRLGYAIGTGTEVEIPVRHMAVTGQTQQSGKTTTLDALASRVKGSVLTFITKRGEGSFSSSRRVAPYFRDRADWQFVTSIIDATLQEKNKFLRPWIMKICRTTKTLAEVQERVHHALETARGINEGVYTQLAAYLDLIVPEIERADLDTELRLQPGVNVMDVSGFATPMQMLFIQSALDWVNERCTDTTVVIPEAWEFVPEGKGSPVKASAVTLVRKGAALRNHIWLDSQDMAGVDKTILRGCTVWLIGVQREANEIKRNLLNIPAGMKRPRAEDIASLQIGQFFACFGSETVKTYVQPAWMAAADAQAYARGEVGIEALATKASQTDIAPVAAVAKEDEVDKATAEALIAQNARLTAQLSGVDEKIETARQEGVKTGFSSGRQSAFADVIEKLRSPVAELLETFDDLAAADTAAAAGQPIKALAASAGPNKKLEIPAGQTVMAAPPKVRVTPPADGSISTAAMKLLHPLVLSYPHRLSPKLLGVAANAAPTGGSWNSKIKQLKDAGYIETDNGNYFATEAGVAAARDDVVPAKIKSDPDLYAYWKEQLRAEIGAVALDILSNLTVIYPSSVSLEQWGLLTRRATTGGSWNAAVKALKDWGCNDVIDRRYVATPLGNAIAELLPDRDFDLARVLRQLRINSLSTSARKLFDNWRDGCTRSDIAEQANLKMTGGSWNSAIKEFLESGLVEEREGKICKIAEDLG